MRCKRGTELQNSTATASTSAHEKLPSPKEPLPPPLPSLCPQLLCKEQPAPNPMRSIAQPQHQDTICTNWGHIAAIASSQDTSTRKL